MNVTDINRVFDVIENDIVPKTATGVRSGSKLFGAAVLRKADFSLVVASTNRETQNPLFHGEVAAIHDFFDLEDHPSPKDCIFLATHEPCSLCLSAITWSGFDNFSYFFTYEDSRDEFAIPYDIEILEQVYRVADPGKSIDPRRPLYNASNKFFESFSIKSRLAELNDSELNKRAQKIGVVYRELSEIYQRSKGQLISP